MGTQAETHAPMAARYNAAEVEARWYEFWEEAGYFRPDSNSDATLFVITIPPPNVTGDLHLGHALTYGIEDILGRFKRMQGYNTLILPGTDHAGIATQNVVEKQLAVEGIDRHALGREAFIERVWQWKDQYASTIRAQFRAMGCAFDWSRERFTMDPAYADAVLEFFIRLYEDGQIYRGWRVINWCVRCSSAISDVEVEDVERDDSLYYIRYPLADGSGDIVVATVRPETILGDAAVAVHPEDVRYLDLVGRSAVLPLLNRKLAIIADSFVDLSFGTGAVKITPAHDFADWEVAERHGLDMPIAIDTRARITDVGGPYAGLAVHEARLGIVRDLEAGGFLVKVEPYRHNVPGCERCGTVLEPLLSEQWFMRMQDLAGPAVDAVESGAVRFVPERWGGIYLDWMERIRPWTLSRQLWWGHRIPIYYCENSHAIAAKSWPAACSHCGGSVVRQDADVLDTWFSSALWPFATLGWPEETQDLGRYFPTSFMNTSSQILYLWIARMIMTGLKFRGDVPFQVVLINPTILNERGQRMSKSLGTGVDPVDLIRAYGADALRFGLMTSGSTHQQEIRFSAERVEQARNFATKVWNVARFILTSQGDDRVEDLNLTTADRWILSRIGEVTRAMTIDLERFEFSGAGHRLHDFVWSELADWYIEMAKARLFDGDDSSQATVRAVLWSVLDRVLRLLHPYMPFVTEEIWQQLRGTGSQAARQLSGWESALPVSVMIAPWPQPENRDENAERRLESIVEIIRAVRAVRSEYRLKPGAFLSATIIVEGEDETIREGLDTIGRLARLRPVAVVDSLAGESRGMVSVMAGRVTVLLPLSELTDVRAELERLGKELRDTEQAAQSVERKLVDQAFVSRAPSRVVVRERERGAELAERTGRLRDQIAALEQ